MRKFLGLLIGLILAMSIFSAAPTAFSVAAVTDWNYYKTLVAQDTLSGATDSINLTPGQMRLSSGYEYILLISPPTGVDSVKYYVYYDNYNQAGTFQKRVAIDTCASQIPKQVVLPIGQTIIGGSCNIKLLSYTGNGSKTIIPPVEIWKRRATIFSNLK
jgi:hypothetical protein